MPGEYLLQLDSLVAAADLRTKQFYAVKLDTAGKINVATAAKGVEGFLQDKPNTGDVGVFAREGVTKAAIAASQTIAIGDLLEVTAGGSLIPLASGLAVARAREALASVAAVKIILVEILRSNVAQT